MASLVNVNKIWLVTAIRAILKAYRKRLSRDDIQRKLLKRKSSKRQLDPESKFRETEPIAIDLADKILSAKREGLKCPTIILCKVGDNYRIVQGHIFLACAIANGEDVVNAIFVKDMF